MKRIIEIVYPGKMNAEVERDIEEALSKLPTNWSMTTSVKRTPFEEARDRKEP